MIAGLFLNPAFLLIGVALISVPIIIHLINRMRFKRIRWAAMEFLLKAQKRTRRRLIIEQLLLLALRCMLIFFLLLLVARFVGCGDNNAAGKPNLHIVLLDDSLSMQDQVKGPDGVTKSAMEVAKQDFLINKIAKGLAKSKTNDELMVVQISRLREPEYKPKVYQSLHDTQKMKDFTQEVNEIEATALHASMLEGIKLAKQLVGTKSESRVTLHLLSDYRFIDWGGKSGEAAYKELTEMVKENNEIRIRTIDAVFPARGAGYPPSNDNVGIVSFRPDTRVVGHKTVVHFTVTIANFSSKQVDVKLNVRNEITGVEEFKIDFNVQTERKDKTRITLSPSGTTDVTFDYGDLKNGLFFPDAPKPGESKFAHLSVRLTDEQMNPLQGDGLLLDNLRHTVVEVRDKVPILVIDGNPPPSPKEAEGKDAFILERALGSITGSSYQVEFPKTTDQLKALEQPNLNKYPTIFLANVRQLNVKQLANLENFVKDGGGVAFYLGSNVNHDYYNKNLYKDGAGIFPAPLKEQFPGALEKELPEKEGSDTEQLLIREDKFGKMDKVPIFKNIFDEPRQRVALLHLPIRRYFKVDRAQWKQEPDRVFELATLPNESPAKAYGDRVAGIVVTGRHAVAILADRKFDKYRTQLQAHFKSLTDVVRPDAAGDLKAYHLAGKIDALLKDRGNPNGVPPVPDLTEFWADNDASVQSLKKELTSLSDDVKYGDPFIISRKFGKGNVIAIMSTAGKDWNDWCGGCLGSVIFQPFVWEMQKELSSPAGDDNLLVGSNLDLAFDAEQFRGANLKLVRHFMKFSAAEGKAVGEKETPVFGKQSDDGKIHFTMTKHNEPGRYEYELFDENQPGKTLSKFSHAYNVDTVREGQLARVGSDELNRELIDKCNEITNNKDTARPVAPGTPDDVLVAKQNDFSESPWLFLILLLVLVSEQALAVHLSFHLKNTEDAAPKGVRA